MSRVIVIADPTLGAVANDVVALLEAARVDTRLCSLDEFRAASPGTRDATVVVIGVGLKFTAELMDAMPNLKAIVSAVIGVDVIDLEAAAKRGIAVGHSPAAEASESLAEAAILLILACLYDLSGNEALVRDNRARPPRPSGRMLMGRTVGLVGFGRAAQAVARRLRPWGVTMLAYARREPAPFDGVRFVPLQQLVSSCDVISVHVALNEESRNLLSASLLSHVKQGAVIVNTARGGVVDEEAVVALVRAGRISSVGFDVFATEPLPMASPLRSLARSVLTPHRLGHTEESFGALASMAANNAIDAVAGRPPRHSVKP